MNYVESKVCSFMNQYCTNQGSDWYVLSFKKKPKQVEKQINGDYSVQSYQPAMGSTNAAPDVPSGTGQHTAHFTLVHVPVTCQIDEYCSYHIVPGDIANHKPWWRLEMMISWS